MNKKSFLILLTLLTITKTTPVKDQLSVIKLKGKLSNLKSTIKNYKYVLVLFNIPETERGAKLKRILKGLYRNLKTEFSMAYLQMTVKEESKRKFEFFLYIEGNRTHYTGLQNFAQVKKWILETRDAKPHKKEKLEDIDIIDRHYFVYVDKSYMAVHEKEVNLLSKLIHPLTIIHGLNSKEQEKITKKRKPSTALWAYREYGDKIIPIQQGKSLKEMSELIINNELPDSLLPNKASLRLILEQKTPVLLYFSKNDKDSFYEEIEKKVIQYKEFLIPVFVNTSKKDKYTKFLIDFMGVKKLPSIRILNMVDKLTRYKFVGKKQISLVTDFLSDYIQGKLEFYNINEKLKKGQMTRGIKKGNYKMFNKILENEESHYLVLIYSNLVDNIEEYFEVLREVKDAFNHNLGFKIVAINHDKNDLDGYYNDAVPFFFIASSRTELHHYEGKLNSDELSKFVIEELPHLKIKDDSVSTDL